jgi:hypothetical protein
MHEKKQDCAEYYLWFESYARGDVCAVKERQAECDMKNREVRISELR